MTPFLKETAQNIIEKHNLELQKLCFVFPNKRTKIFFRKYYAEVLGKTDFAPEMKEIRILVRNFTKLAEPDRLSLIFDLFDIFTETVKDNENAQKYNFDSFYKLGEIILNDFNEIDSWLVDPKSIFKNIKDTQEIDSHFDWLTDEQKEILKNFWVNFSPEKDSKEKQKFIELWNLLPKLYIKLKTFLLNKKVAYNGLMYRELSEKIDNNTFKIDNKKKYLFIGFNALNNSEIKLFEYLKNNNNAEFYWDTDAYYLNDKKQEAGDFIRKNLKILNLEKNDIPNNFIQEEKKIDLIGVPQRVGQAKIIKEILGKYNAKENLNETAIILADEHLLFPVLHSLPEYIETINVTMGYPFNMTSLFDLIQKYAKLRLDFLKKDNKVYYYKDIIAIVKHPAIWEFDSDSASSLVQEIVDKNLLFISPQFLLKNTNKLFPNLFNKLSEENPADAFLTNIMNILFILFNKNLPEENEEVQKLENEYIYKAYVKIKRFRELIRHRSSNLSLMLVIDLLKQVLSAEQIPFAGKAQDGIQIMGVLESRNLDFKNVIVLGVNEGNLPSVSSPSSFISQSVRYVFGMPLIKFQDSVYAYLFYRTIQRAKNISLIYNNIVSDANSGEKSRFILQLLYESKLNITEKQFTQKISPHELKEITIKKDSDVFKILDDYIIKGGKSNRRLTPSSINTYINCSLKFYFRYIAKIKSPKQVEEEISHAAFGIILHDSLMYIYESIKKNNKHNIIEKQDIILISKDLDKFITQAFVKYYNTEKSDYKFENNQIIIKEVIKKYVINVLKQDQKHTPFEIVSLENEKFFHAEFDIEYKQEKEQIGLFGIIDRVDKKDNIYRIIDYKTGFTDKSIGSVEEMFDKFITKRKEHALQTFLYAKLFIEKHKPIKIDVVPCIYDVRKMADPKFTPYFYNKIEKKYVDAENLNSLMPEFENKLSETLTELYNENIDFCQTDDTKKCEFCDYNIICNKL